MLRISRLAACRWLAANSPEMCGRRSGLACSRSRCPVQGFSRQAQLKNSGKLAFAGHRTFCSQRGADGSSGRQPDISVVGIPDPITWIRCKVTLLLVELFFDLDVNSDDFERGVKQALVHISSLMSKGKYFELIGVVSVEMIRYIEERCQPLPQHHRQHLAVSMDDIIFVLPEDISVVFDSHGRKFCTIVMRLWYLTTLDGPEDPEGTRIFRVSPGPDGVRPKKVATAVYEFHREMTKGASQDWMVTTVWHWNWKPTD
ncbi:m-AAA protease-interacting protein 1, mitochondrial [Syngnathus acus]|uniref:m-AAA protease-interacting protein 1, mitochondrial n=1 Tax=Syngnathus acus TaxID=161584 RepID=UPI001885DB65|nr:m-AAA protease-interacting protein 1, mitochondrial [Syngnathus acus]